jgi:hypothetical protein
MRKIEILPVGATGRKMVEYFPNGVTLQCVESTYTKGKVDIHITIDGGNENGKGFLIGESLTAKLPANTIEIIEFLGSRIVSDRCIVYGRQMNDVKAKLSKLADTRVIAEYIAESLSN